MHLSGLRVVDFSAVYAGPICTRLMADAGADVIKVEPPNGGDVVRGHTGKSRGFTHFNAGKKSVAIDLNQPAGQDVARQLIATADVVVENYRPGIMKRFGLDYDSVAADNPALVYCSISGFGQSGPFVERAAYASIAHAASGFDHVFLAGQGDTNARPPVSNIMIADMLTGAFANGAIMTALVGRGVHGRGEYIDVTMLESMMMLIPAHLQLTQLGKRIDGGGFHPIQCADGFVMVCIVTPKNLKGLAKAIGSDTLASDPRFQIGKRPKYMGEFIAEIERFTRALSTEACETAMNAAGVPCSVYNKLEDVLSHPQVTYRGSFHEVIDEGEAFLINAAPFQFRHHQHDSDRLTPHLGEHSGAVLASLGLGSEDIEALRAAKVIAA